VTKVLRSDANKNRDKNGDKKQDEKKNKENKPAFEDQVILSSPGENIDNAELHIEEDKEQPGKKNLIQPQEAAEDEENDSKHVDIKA
jgi:hypothetical protein